MIAIMILDVVLTVFVVAAMLSLLGRGIVKDKEMVVALRGTSGRRARARTTHPARTTQPARRQAGRVPGLIA
jgi:hypothetical protein